jgi:toxin ParE1/3/4
MARFRLSEPAKADLAAILRRSGDLHGAEARNRYRACLTAAMRRVATDPDGRLTVDRGSLAPGLRSFHIRHERERSDKPSVAEPVHILFYRVTAPGLIEIARVLHQRMDPSRHFDAPDGYVKRGS